MRTSQFPYFTLRDTPAEAETLSHQLMLRAGLIRKLASGLYTWLPLGLRVLRRVEAVVREAMDRAGALEVLMPAVQPAELWQESGRWERYGPELLRFQDRHQRAFCFGPTHEEIITDLARQALHSYRQLPVNFYQIQSKFRDEIRPRFGVMRAREFVMKDAYSFHLDAESLAATYQTMYATYTEIFTRLGLEFRAVLADTGSIGGQSSHEFHVLADTGEDLIACSDTSSYAANVELAPTLPSATPRAAATLALTEQATPEQRSIEAVSAHLGVTPQQCLKTLLVAGREGGLVALVLRGDHTLNAIKAAKLTQAAEPLRWATPAEAEAALACPAGFWGPMGLPPTIPVIADFSAQATVDAVVGANRVGWHLSGFNWGRDAPEPDTADLRQVEAGDPSPDGSGKLMLKRGIEVGHIFQLGQKYSAALNASVLDEQGRPVVLTMGCYGIGVSRIVAAAIEQNHDAQGICWPEALAPFTVALVPISLHKSSRLREAVAQLYTELSQAGFSVLLDDRDVRPGVMFADMELIGIPHRVVLSERNLDAGVVEYKNRRTSVGQHLPRADVVSFLRQACGRNDKGLPI